MNKQKNKKNNSSEDTNEIEHEDKIVIDDNDDDDDDDDNNEDNNDTNNNDNNDTNNNDTNNNDEDDDEDEDEDEDEDDTKNENCDGLTFADCELSILRMAVDRVQEKTGEKLVRSDEIQKIIKIVETFLRDKQLICYGGTAINNILPKKDQFYDKNVEIPDYDFFTINGIDDAKELADIYSKEGFKEVEAKSGVHHGTFKVFVNFIPVADITNLPEPIFNALKREAIKVDNILYAPPNFLRMGMYLELSRPEGDTSRWEKVLKRLTLLNKDYPLTSVNCDHVDFQREMEDKENEDKIYDIIKNTLIDQGVVFFGGFAISIYSRYMPRNLQKKLNKIADFDVLAEEPKKTAETIKQMLENDNITNVDIIKHRASGEIIPEHYEIKIGRDIVAFIYQPVACHSYNVIKINGKKVKIATIDTMLSFYLAFLYADNPYYTHYLDRILCMSKLLFDVQQKNRLKQQGVLKRFSIKCYGHQNTLEGIRQEKARKFKEFKDSNVDRKSKEYEEWFLNYKPVNESLNNNNNNNNNNTNYNNNNNNKMFTKRKKYRKYSRKFAKKPFTFKIWKPTSKKTKTKTKTKRNQKRRLELY